MPTEQLTKSTHEQKSFEIPIDQAISRMAESHGLSLEPQRLRQLVAQVEYRRDLESRGGVLNVQFEDTFNDVYIKKPMQVEGFDGTASKVDFTPALDEDDDDDWLAGAASARPDHATQVTLKGIRGMQNYALLVGAGLLERPDILYGETNPTMAITTERIGLLSDIARQYGNDKRAAHDEMRNQKTLVISGEFEEVSARLFSSDTRKLEKLLMKRQTTPVSMGNVALR